MRNKKIEQLCEMMKKLHYFMKRIKELELKDVIASTRDDVILCFPRAVVKAFQFKKKGFEISFSINCNYYFIHFYGIAFFP